MTFFATALGRLRRRRISARRGDSPSIALTDLPTYDTSSMYAESGVQDTLEPEVGSGSSHGTSDSAEVDAEARLRSESRRPGSWFKVLDGLMEITWKCIKIATALIALLVLARSVKSIKRCPSLNDGVDVPFLSLAASATSSM